MERGAAGGSPYHGPAILFAGGIFAMPDANGKYRGTTTYFHVLAELVRAAQYRGLTTYQDIALLMGLPLAGNYMGEGGRTDLG